MCALREPLGDIVRIEMHALFIIIVIITIIIIIIIIIVIVPNYTKRKKGKKCTNWDVEIA